ncbi:diguanylate cyclase domain-containing protein [Brevundimonas sp.]|uniref:diguanylate cyclase domain-containing protein n=1 Tax=Brevundimonas sp. TaxID=1871086 RepID=UPI00289990A3|nr:diguanylate cyclase [Brevundimonas sp.]
MDTTHPSDFASRVLVVASEDGRLNDLAARLDVEGWPTVVVPDMSAAIETVQRGAIDAALIHLDTEALQRLDELRAAAPWRYLSILALGGDGAPPPDVVDLRLSGHAHPSQIAQRLEQLVRAAIAEEEFRLRAETLSSYGIALELPQDQDSPVTVLAVGAADHRFLGLSNSLSQEGAQVVAAPTPYTAFDYLHERPFDATILWGGENRSVAMSIASGMKRNTRLYHIPIMLYLQRGDEVNLTDLYNRGFADVANATVSEAETAERIMALAQNHRRRAAIRKALDSVRVSNLTDPVTGLFNSEPFAHHLRRVYSASRSRQRKLSLCVLKVVRTEALGIINQGGYLDRALPQVGAMISRLVRVEDTAARLSPDTFALMMPATGADAAHVAAERIAAVIACTAFEAGEGRSPFVLEFDIGVAEMKEGEGPIQLLERAVADARTKAAA